MDKIHTRLNSHKAGLTLPEMLIGFGLLGLLSLIIFFTLQSTHMAQKSQSGRSDKNTRLILARMNLIDAVRGARLVTPSSANPTSDHIVLQKPKFEQGLQAVDVLGSPTWRKSGSIRMMEGGFLKQDGIEGGPRVLAKLGAQGSFEVRREKPFTFFQLTIKDTPEAVPETMEVKVYMPLEVVLGATSFGL